MSEASLRDLREAADKIINTWPKWKRELIYNTKIGETMLVPFDGFVIVEQENGKKVSDGGIIIPEAYQKKTATGKVVAVPEGGYQEIKVGDRVLFAPFSGKNIVIEGSEYLIINYCDIEAKLA